ncbi:MAG TPA: GMC oxidoreductase [Pyrinomonadaceae bacterium]|nr:GMC oxidoreductase [Pyrinomonadaceae bacterium]
MIFIIGSGPAGVSCAAALVSKGLDVTMLDAGTTLEPERQKIVGQLAGQDHGDWDPIMLEHLKVHKKAGRGGVDLKYSYGSDFPYRESETYVQREFRNAAMLSSLARGGLSNVWGAAILPYVAQDITDWPITLEDLAPHYSAAISLMGLTAATDNLESRFPLYSNQYSKPLVSRQAAQLLQDLQACTDRLGSDGVIFGHSRLAVYAENRDHRQCATCGLCLYGCPYGLIYNSALTVEQLSKHPNFNYVDGVIVRKLEEAHGGVRVLGQSKVTGEKLVFDAARVFVAAGTLSSTKLILDSLEAYERTVTFKDSQYFMFPLLRYRGVPRVADEALHTLAQLFVEISDPNLCDKTIHLQIYSYNDLYKLAMLDSFGFFSPILKSPTNAFLNRFLLVQGYLHSDVSPTITARLQAPEGESPGKFILEGSGNERGRAIIQKVTAKLNRNRNCFKAIPLKPLMKIGLPGHGNHSGGSLPMRLKSSEFETDLAGRPYGFKKIHVVDSSVFPSIPATTITLSIMANAHRIAASYEQYQD